MSDRNLDLALRVTADTAQGRAALSQLNRSLAQAGRGGERALDPFTASVARATGGARELTTSLGPLQRALGGLAAAVSVRQLIDTADAYGQMTARLRLATQYTGDFAEVQQALKQAARETRAPLEETVNLYSRLAPSLAALGLSGAPAVGVIRTVNQAIALSGASAGESQAALVQFGQALASGVLRGDELNSILEQTPGLADAIAEGLGKTRGQLRALGAEGALTATAVVGALQRVSARVDADFAQLPMTVGQAMTLLRNQLSEIVGEADQGSGALAGLARAIVFVSEGVAGFAASGAMLRPVVEFVTDAVDGVSRLFRVIATGLAGYVLAVQQLARGDLQAALQTYREIGKEVDRILLEPLAADTNRAAQARSNANARLKVEQDLADAVARLESLRAVAAGKASAEILLDEKALADKRIAEQRRVIQEQIKGYEALRTDLRRVWQESVEGARRAGEESARLFEAAASAQRSRQQQAQDRRDRGLTPEERDAKARREAALLTDEAYRAAVFAQNAAIDGRAERSQEYAQRALALSQEAARYAEQIGDDDGAARLLDRIGAAEKRAMEAQARLKQQEAAQQQELAREQQAQIQSNEERLSALRAELERPATITADITEAERQIEILKGQLEKLSDKTVTVTIKAVTESGAPMDGNQIAGLPGRAYGGPLPGRAYGDRSDNVIYRGTPGEWVIQRPAVRYWGSSFIRAINEMRMPKFAYGGELGQEQRAALGDQGSRESIVLQWPDGSRSPMSASRDVADDVLRLFRAAALQRGRRK